MQRLSLRVAAAACVLVMSPAWLSAATNDKIQEHGETIYLARDFIFVDVPAIESYLQTICRRLLDAKGANLATLPKILVQSSDAFNAFTDANGHLVISTGALRAMESEDELAALLGHELSHLILKHPQGKDVMSSLPLGMDTMTSVQEAAAELKGQRATDSPQQHADEQPPVERLQLRRAGIGVRNGKPMRTASSSCGRRAMTHLHSASSSRSCRLRKFSARNACRFLKKTLVVRLRQAGSKVAASSGRSETLALTSEVKGALADDASEKLVDSLSAFNRFYDSPDERQTALANYAREHREKTRASHPSVQIKDVLQGGEGGTVLVLDGAAIVTMNALASRNTAVAKLAVQSLGSGDAKQPSAHLNLAIGSYNELYGDANLEIKAAITDLVFGLPSIAAAGVFTEPKLKPRPPVVAPEALVGKSQPGAMGFWAFCSKPGMGRSNANAIADARLFFRLRISRAPSGGPEHKLLLSKLSLFAFISKNYKCEN